MTSPPTNNNFKDFIEKPQEPPKFDNDAFVKKHHGLNCCSKCLLFMFVINPIVWVASGLFGCCYLCCPKCCLDRYPKRDNFTTDNYTTNNDICINSGLILMTTTM